MELNVAIMLFCSLSFTVMAFVIYEVTSVNAKPKSKETAH